jgi:hypothetical protein
VNDQYYSKNSMDPKSEGDFEILIDQVWNDLQGQVNRATVQQMLLEVIREYEDATITTFVPIFIRRDAVDTLRGTLVQAEVDPVTKRRLLPERTTVRHNLRGLQRFWRPGSFWLMVVTERWTTRRETASPSRLTR